MRQVIINADDFGQSSGMNLGVIQAHEDGILTSGASWSVGQRQLPLPNRADNWKYGLGGPRAMGVPLFNLVGGSRAVMLQVPCCELMPRRVSEPTLDSASVFDRTGNAPAIILRQCPVPACGHRGLHVLGGHDRNV